MPAKNSVDSRLHLSPQQRIRSGRDFERIYAARFRAGDARLLIFGLRNTFAHARFGLSVSRKHGGSIARHRLRRRLREAFRLEQHQLPEGYDFILIPGAEAATAPMEQLRQSLTRLAHKAARSAAAKQNAAIPLNKDAPQIKG